MGSINIITDKEELYTDRSQVAEMLTAHLSKYSDSENVIVLGIPRGGVIIAGIIAEHLNAELDIVLTCKIRAPHNPELAAGAVSEDGKVFINQSIMSSLGITQDYIKSEKEYQMNKIEQRRELYRQVLEKKSLKNKIVILTDDGVATGATMQAAVWAAASEFPKKIILALPVAPPETLNRLAKDTDEIICLCAPDNFFSISQFYTYFEQVEDEQVIEVLKNHTRVKK